MAFTQLQDFTTDELSGLIAVLEAERPRAVVPAIASYVELAICAATGVLYHRLVSEGDSQGALAVLARFGSAQAL